MGFRRETKIFVSQGGPLIPAFYATFKSDASFDLVTICPPYVLGPIIHQADSAESLNTCKSTLPIFDRVFPLITLAVANWWAFLTGQKTTEEVTNPAGILCDVRDVAQCHVKALLSENAAGKRIGIATRESTPVLSV